jgi:tetratricopeptide (TPR) repeat protein
LLLSVFIAFTTVLTACAGAERKDRAERAYVAASEAYGRERFAEALDYAGESLRIDPDFYQARLLEGKILFFQNRLEEAEKTFAALCAKHPEYTEARLWNLRCLVLSLEQSGLSAGVSAGVSGGKDVQAGPRANPGADLKKVQAAQDRELSFNPSDWRVLYLYALLAGNTGDWEKRLSMGRRAEAVLSDSAKVYLDMALSWHSLGLEDRASLSLEKARAVAGENISLARLAAGAAELFDKPKGDYDERLD